MFQEYRIVHFLEWCTELPTVNCPKISPILLLNDCERFFRFVLEKSPNGTWYYELYLEIKSEHLVFKEIQGNLQVGFKKQITLDLGNKTFKIPKLGRTEIWFISKENLQPKLPLDYWDGNWIKILVSFDDASLLKIKDEGNDKSVQTPVYLDTNFLLEGISKDFSILFDEGEDKDVEFICEDETIKAHKNILCSRSNVLATMLRSDMSERRTGQVNIADMKSSVLREFLRYLYSGVMPEFSVDTALQYYEAADKYAVDALKKQCSSFLSENLSHDNVCEILIASDKHNDEEFKKTIMEYIMKEKIPRRIGEKWTDFCKENQALAVEVLNFLYQSDS